MSYRVFTEKEVRKQILRKIKPQKVPGSRRKRSDHWIRWVELDGQFVLKVKIPNTHNKSFKPQKAKRLAHSLRLDEEEYNDLIGCAMSGTDYYKLLTDEPDRI